MNYKVGKKPSLFVAQPVKWMNLKDLQLSVEYKTFFVSSDTLSSKYRYERDAIRDVKLNSLNKRVMLCNALK